MDSNIVSLRTCRLMKTMGWYNNAEWCKKEYDGSTNRYYVTESYSSPFGSHEVGDVVKNPRRCSVKTIYAPTFDEVIEYAASSMKTLLSVKFNENEVKNGIVSYYGVVYRIEEDSQSHGIKVTDDILSQSYSRWSCLEKLVTEYVDEEYHKYYNCIMYQKS